MDQILQMLNDPNPGVREAASSCIEVRKIPDNCFLPILTTTTIVIFPLSITTTAAASGLFFLLVSKQENVYYLK